MKNPPLADYIGEEQRKMRRRHDDDHPVYVDSASCIECIACAIGIIVLVAIIGFIVADLLSWIRWQ